MPQEKLPEEQQWTPFSTPILYAAGKIVTLRHLTACQNHKLGVIAFYRSLITKFSGENDVNITRYAPPIEPLKHIRQ